MLIERSDLELLNLTDQCVKCGLCLPHCPTYEQIRHEGDSPRGRIALIEGWLEGNLKLNPTVIAHLDNCLGCRACERACPSGVQFGQLFDEIKSRQIKNLPTWKRDWQRKWLLILSNDSFLIWLKKIIYPIKFFLKIKLLIPKRFLLLKVYQRLAYFLSIAPSVQISRAESAVDFELFTGCTGISLQGNVITAIQRVCTQLGLRVGIAAKSFCCGALLRHNGYPEEANQKRAASAQYFAGRPIIGFSSACIAELRTEPALAQIQEICEFLDQLTWPESVSLLPLAANVFIHEPCSHRHLLGGNAAVYKLLARIPEIKLISLTDNFHCCGAAGTYFLRQPQLAELLLNNQLLQLSNLIQALKLKLDNSINYLVTTNPGCVLYLTNGLREAGLKIKVCHPIELISLQIINKKNKKLI